MQFLTPPHKHIFLHFLIEKKPLKISIQGNNLHNGMPKKMTPKSQAKIKLPFPIFNYF